MTKKISTKTFWNRKNEPRNVFEKIFLEYKRTQGFASLNHPKKTIYQSPVKSTIRIQK